MQTRTTSVFVYFFGNYDSLYAVTACRRRPTNRNPISRNALN